MLSRNGSETPTFRALLVPLFLVLTVAAGCSDLGITDPNEPGLDDAIADAATAEAVIAGAFATWHEAQYDYDGIAGPLSTASFQHSTPWCHMSALSTIPRRPVPLPPDPYAPFTQHAWHTLYRSLVGVADGMRALDAAPALWTDLGEADASRLRAFARFVQGLGHGSLALLYDQGVVVDERTDPGAGELVGYPVLMDTALAYLAEAAALADGRDWTIPASWMSVEVPAGRLGRLAHAFAARFRAAVARTPAERAAVDWDAVVADVDAGIAEDWAMALDPNTGWYAEYLDYANAIAWSQETYFITGMADGSGSYQRWLAEERAPESRLPNPDTDGDGAVDPILIVTPDTRFPQGASLSEQEAHPGSLYAIPMGLTGQLGGRDRAWDIAGVWFRPERGSWRWSYYWATGAEAYTHWTDFRWPVITVAEMRLLEAEALLRDGDAAGAAALVNVTRTAAGLSPTDGAGTNIECVPRLPDGTCGGLMEMLKWEKRLETRMKGPFMASWYFDGRGWGDLYAGTFLQLPVPCDELRLLGEDCYTFGGEGEGAAPGSVYAWPEETT